jgi:hypothetical protein
VPYRICRGQDCLQTAAAHAIQRESGRVNLKTASQRRYSSQIHVLGVGMDHIAEDDVTYIGFGKARALHALAYNPGRKFTGGDIFECSAEFPDGSSDGAQNDYFSVRHDGKPFFAWNGGDELR